MQNTATTGKVKKHVTTACTNCRRSKAKCDGLLPCQTCQQKSRECYYEARNDARTKRAHDQLSSRSELLDNVIDTLRNGSSKDREALLRTINDEVEIDSLSEQVGALSKRVQQSTKRPKHSVMNINTLVDQPFVRVKAQPWTEVTSDDEAVSHLLSAYFAWQHSSYALIDWAIFCREMNRQDLSSQHCSKFLVNALLALGCTYTDHPAAFAEPGDEYSRGSHFLEEAIRLWTLEEGAATLTNLQALAIMVVCVTFHGKDRLALFYGSQISSLRQNLESKARKGRRANDAEYTNDDFLRSFSHAGWGSFSLEVELSMAWKIPFSLNRPSMARPYSQEELESSDSWRPYPMLEPELALRSKLVNNVGYDLFVIGADICSVLLSGNPQDSPLPGHIILEASQRLAKATEIEEALTAWHDELPATFTLVANEPQAASEVPGPVVDVLMTYNVWRITVNSMVLNEVTATDAERELAEEEILSACRRIADLIRHCQNHFGILSFPCTLPHSASIGAHHLLQFIPRDGVLDLIHTMVLGLTSSFYRITLVRGIMKSLYLTIKEQKLESLLQEQTFELLKLNAVDKWSMKDHLLFATCAYPNYATSSLNGRDLITIGDLLDNVDLNRGVEVDGHTEDPREESSSRSRDPQTESSSRSR